MNDHDLVVRALQQAEFAYPVAIHPGVAPEIGPVLEVHAFDVPEEDAVRVSFDLTQLVRRCKLAAIPLVGCYDQVESDDKREELPVGARWFRVRNAVGMVEGIRREAEMEMFTLTFSGGGSGWMGSRLVGRSVGQVSAVREPCAVYRGSGGVAVLDERFHWALHFERPSSDPHVIAVNTHYSLAS